MNHVLRNSVTKYRCTKTALRSTMSLPYPISPGGDNSSTVAVPPADVDNRPSYYPGTTEPVVTMAAAAGYPMPHPGGCSGWPYQPEYPVGYPAPAAQYPPEQYPGYAPSPPQPGFMPGYPPPQDSCAYPPAAPYMQNTYPDPRNGFAIKCWFESL